MKDCNIVERMFPEEFAYEMFRMKRYEPNGVDEFNDHVDVGNHVLLQNGSWYSFYTSMNQKVGKLISHKEG